MATTAAEYPVAGPEMFYTFNATHDACTDPRFPGAGHPVQIYVRARSLIEAQRDAKFSFSGFTVDLTPVGVPVESLSTPRQQAR